MEKIESITGKFVGLVFLIGIFLSSCGGANKRLENDVQYRELVEEVNDLDFEIENEWANPLQYSRVNLIGNPNHITFENDSVKVFLPYFGERYAGGGYNMDGGGIQYKGEPQKLEIEENPRKGTVVVNFEGNRKTENLDFTIIIFSNGVTRTSVRSSQRSTITYDGRLVNQ